MNLASLHKLLHNFASRGVGEIWQQTTVTPPVSVEPKQPKFIEDPLWSPRPRMPAVVLPKEPKYSYSSTYVKARQEWEKKCKMLRKEAKLAFQPALTMWEEKQSAYEQEIEALRSQAREQWREGPLKEHRARASEARKQYRLEAAKAQQELDNVKHRYCRSECDAHEIVNIAEQALKLTLHPPFLNDVAWMEQTDVYYDSVEKVIQINRVLPRAIDIRANKGYKEREFCTVEIPATTKEIASVYPSVLHQLMLITMMSVFEAGDSPSVRGVCVNGSTPHINPATGQKVNPVTHSLYVSREEYDALDMLHVDPTACFKALKGVAGSVQGEPVAIAPILNLQTSDRRIIENREVEVSTSQNLASMDWQDFEHLVRNLLEKEMSGDDMEIKVTQSSRDGGVDALIFDPHPLRGGKIIVQAKRYTNVVGVSAVRELHGTVSHEGAMKGILVTTSSFGHDAYEYAKDKPLSLINGANLLYFLSKHGIEGRIDIPEARASRNK